MAATDFLDARDVAAQLLLLNRRGKPDVARLRRLAERGEYPELLHVCQGQYRVRRSDHEAWMAARMTKAELEQAEFDAARIAATVGGS
jgi:hypothetical protein